MADERKDVRLLRAHNTETLAPPAVGWMNGSRATKKEKFWKEDHIIKFSCESNLHFTLCLFFFSLSTFKLSPHPPFDHSKYQQWQSFWMIPYFCSVQTKRARSVSKEEKIFTNIAPHFFYSSFPMKFIDCSVKGSRFEPFILPISPWQGRRAVHKGNDSLTISLPSLLGLFTRHFLVHMINAEKCIDRECPPGYNWS